MSKSIMEINTPFKALLATLNSLLEVLNKLGYKIYDSSDPDYYIKGITYNSEKDRLEAEWEEDR
jgi:hypothetical protein